MANNYKTDAGKAPVVSAVFIPFGRTLLALAEMMERQKIRHQLQGAKNPFQEWRQLPEGKDRLVNAGGRHLTDPWSPNVADRVGDHPGDLHILHSMWGLMAAYEKHLEEGEATPKPAGREEVLARELAAHRASLYTADRARTELALQGESPADTCCGAPDAQAIHVPAGADWLDRSMERAFPEHHQVAPRCLHCVNGHQCVYEEGHTHPHYTGCNL